MSTSPPAQSAALRQSPPSVAPQSAAPCPRCAASPPLRSLTHRLQTVAAVAMRAHRPAARSSSFTNDVLQRTRLGRQLDAAQAAQAERPCVAQCIASSSAGRSIGVGPRGAAALYALVSQSAGSPLRGAGAPRRQATLLGMPWPGICRCMPCTRVTIDAMLLCKSASLPA